MGLKVFDYGAAAMPAEQKFNNNDSASPHMPSGEPFGRLCWAC